MQGENIFKPLVLHLYAARASSEPKVVLTCETRRLGSQRAVHSPGAAVAPWPTGRPGQTATAKLFEAHTPGEVHSAEEMLTEKDVFSKEVVDLGAGGVSGRGAAVFRLREGADWVPGAEC